MVQSWKAEWFEDMKLYWQQLQGDAPPQSTAGSAVSQGNMGPDALRPLGPSDDREASRAQHKSGTKRAGSDSRNHSSSRERSSVDQFRPRDRRPPTSPGSPSPTQQRSPTAKRSRRDWRERSNDSCSSEGRQRSQRYRRPWSSRSPGHWRRDHFPSPSPPRRYRSSPAPSRRSSGAGMTKRPVVVAPPHRRLRAGLHLIDDGLAIPHATVFHLLRPVLVGLIIAYHPPLLGRLHPKGLEPRISLTLAAPPGLSARSVVNTHMIRIFVSCDCGRTLMMNIILLALIHVVPPNQDNLLPWMTLISLRQRSKNFSPIWYSRQNFPTTPIPFRLVLPINSWSHMYAHLRRHLLLSRTVSL